MDTKDTYDLDLENYYGNVKLVGGEGDWVLELDNNCEGTDTLAIPDYLAEAFIKFINEEKEK